jgi:hypothetical protein
VSALGSYEVLNRVRFAGCLALARNVRAETTGKWIFKSTRITGVAEFNEAWRASVLQAVHFDHSGYVLGNYVDAQLAINQTQLIDEQSEPARILSAVFTAAFVFDTSRSLPDLPEEKLNAFCRAEYDHDAPGMIEAIKAAHAFYARGLTEITPENLVVFVIR